MARRKELWEKWLRTEGIWVVMVKPRSVGESGDILFVTTKYTQAWRYWYGNPEGRPRNELWQIAQRRWGALVPQRPIPPDKFKILMRMRVHQIYHAGQYDATCAYCEDQQRRLA